MGGFRPKGRNRYGVMDFIPHYPPIGVETVRGSVQSIPRNLGVNINEKTAYVSITNRQAG